MLLVHPTQPRLKIYLKLHRTGFLASVLFEDLGGGFVSDEQNPFWASVVARSLSRNGATHLPLIALQSSSTRGFTLTTNTTLIAQITLLSSREVNPFSLEGEELALSILADFDSHFDLGLLQFLGGFKCTNTSLMNLSDNSQAQVSTCVDSTTPSACSDSIKSQWKKEYNRLKRFLNNSLI